MTGMTRRSTLGIAAIAAGASLLPIIPAQASAHSEEPDFERLTVRHRSVKIRGLDVFYREAGPKDAPALLLLHGFPTSSHMFRHLIPALADRFRVIAPDYPGFGQSSLPDPNEFTFTFAALTDIIADFTDLVGLNRHAIYIQDFGAPIGLRLALMSRRSKLNPSKSSE